MSVAEAVSFVPGRGDAQPPHNIEAEAGLLGGLMNANSCIDRIADIVLPEHFFEPLHGRIFSAILAQHSRGLAANPVTLKPFFDADQPMKELGGPAYLAQLSGSPAAVIGVGDLARQIFELAQLRAVIGICRKAIERAHEIEEEIPVEAVAAELEAGLAELTRGSEDGALELSAGDCIGAVFEAMASGDSGVTCGIEPIDKGLGPIRRKNLAILAGRPGMAKSATASCYARGAAGRGHGVLFISVEMSAEEIGERLACDWCYDSAFPVLYDKVVHGTADEHDRRQLARAQMEIGELPFQVIDAANLSVHRLGRIVRRWKRRFAARGQSLDLVVVDYLQKLRAPGCSNRFEIITEISHTLKEIAKANDVGVLALSQLSREVEKREDKRPQMSDLRESGAIEQDADAILFLYRAEYYLERSLPPEWHEDYAEAAADLDKVRGDIEFICAKRRKGRAGTTKGRFYGQFQAVRGVFE